jgi:hypothetical protein
MQDRSILDHIQELVDEEHHLLEAAAEDAAARSRLHSVETQLDQCWDLLRQRRAKRHAGQDPDDARVRDAPTVEHYQQ